MQELPATGTQPAGNGARLGKGKALNTELDSGLGSCRVSILHKAWSIPRELGKSQGWDPAG